MGEYASGALGRLLIAAGAAVVMIAAPVVAQDDEADQPAPAPGIPEKEAGPGGYGLEATDYSLRLRTSWEPHTDFKDSNATVKVWRAGAEFTAVAPLNERWRVRLRADSEYSNWNFDGPTGLAPGSAVPFEEISTHGISLGVENAINDKWSWTGQGRIEVGLEGEAKAWDGVSGELGGGVLYQAASNVKLGVGLAVLFPIEEYTRVVPLPLVDAEVELTEHLLITASLPRSLALRYAPDRDFFMDLGVRVRYKSYRMSGDNATPEGVFREFAVPLMLEANWRFEPAWTLQAGIGTNIYQRLEMDDREGFEQGRERTRASAIFSLGLKWDF
jgi:hypothetical protein